MAVGALSPVVRGREGEPPRPDLAGREETKYRCDGADLEAIRAVLARRCRPIRYAGPVSTVYSLYFDGPTLAACRANLDGVGIRHKSRLRWYDHPTPVETLYLETKWRRHRTTGKHRIPLSVSRDPFGIPLRLLHRSIVAALPPGSPAPLEIDPDAVVLVEYRRRHFAVEGTAARITLDWDLRVHGQLEGLYLSRRFGERLADLVIIEAKCPVGERAALDGVLAPLRLRPRRFSKYVTACQLLGYISDV